MSERAKGLVAQLRNYRARKAAMDELLMMGDEAVPTLIEALGHRIDSIRWCARQVLADIGGEAATAALVEALDEPRRQEEAARALSEMTGKSIGPDRAAWEEYLNTGVAPTGAAAERLSDEALVKAAIKGTPISAATRKGGAVLTVPVGGARKQRVTVNFAAKDFEGEALIVVYTECGPAEAKNFEWALRQNLRMSFGAVAVRDRDGEPTFVMVNTHLRATATPDDLRKSIQLLARKGDALEKALTKADER